MNRTTTIISATVIIAIIIVAAVIGLYVANNPNGGNSSPSTLKVLATFYPLYDFAQNVGGNKINASILVPETVDVHDFDPTPSDIQNIATADVLIYNGADLEKTWLSSAVSASGNTKLVLVDTSQNITLLPSRTTIPKRRSNGRPAHMAQLPPCETAGEQYSSRPNQS